MKTTLALLLVALAFDTPAHAASKKKDTNCLAVVVGSPQQLSKNGDNDNEREFEAGANTFSATQVLDVQFAIVFSPAVAADFDEARIVEFRVYTPAGNLYQSLSIPVSTDPRKAGERHRVAGYPDLVPLQILQPLKHGGNSAFLAKVTLPVAGTPIMNNSLYGRWRAEAFVDDAVAACAQPAVFTIVQ